MKIRREDKVWIEGEYQDHNSALLVNGKILNIRVYYPGEMDQFITFCDYDTYSNFVDYCILLRSSIQKELNHEQ